MLEWSDFREWSDFADFDDALDLRDLTEPSGELRDRREVSSDRGEMSSDRGDISPRPSDTSSERGDNDKSLDLGDTSSILGDTSETSERGESSRFNSCCDGGDEVLAGWEESDLGESPIVSTGMMMGWSITCL